jgi:hypothetical protein
MSWTYFASTCSLTRFLKVFWNNRFESDVEDIGAVLFSFQALWDQTTLSTFRGPAPNWCGYKYPDRFWISTKYQIHQMIGFPESARYHVGRAHHCIRLYHMCTYYTYIYIHINSMMYIYILWLQMHTLSTHTFLPTHDRNVRKGSAACFRYVWPIKIPGLPLMSSWSEHRRETNRPFQLDAGGARCAAWTRRSESLEE